MRQDLKRLVEARMGEKDKQGNITVVWEEGNEVHDFWKDKLKLPIFQESKIQHGKDC